MNLKRHNRVYILSCKHTYLPMRARVVAQLFYKSKSRIRTKLAFRLPVLCNFISVKLSKHDWGRKWDRTSTSRGGVGGVSPIHGLYRYVPRDRAWFLMFLRSDRSFVPVGIVFPMWSLDRVPKLYQLKLQCVCKCPANRKTNNLSKEINLSYFQYYRNEIRLTRSCHS